MELLVCMSISGSIPVVICLLLYVIQRENYNYILGRRLLLTGIFFYLVPIQLIKYLIPEEVYPEALFNEEAQLYLSNSLSFWTERKGEYIWMPQWFDIVSKLWLSGIVIFAVYEIIKYWRSAHSIKNFIFEKEEDPENNLTYYLIPDETYGPCTIGFFRQRIVIPESFPLHPDFVMVYKHEGAHLKNHDNLVKLLCLLVLCVHWMNPVAYLLLFLYIDTAEIVSDSAAVEGCSKEKRKDYAKLLVLEASTSDIRPVVWKNNLSGHKKDKEGKDFKTLKRRINYMMKEKRKGLLQRGIMVAVSALTIIAGAGTVLAYEAMPSSDISFEDTMSDDSLDVFAYNDSEFDEIDFLDFSESNSIFVGDDGILIACDESVETYALCTHSMVNGKFYTHAPNSSGGCTVKVYTCQRCKKCGYLANKKYYNTITYAVCTHNY
ncbi:M56 family metallopeptidase [Blautia wexlerae]|uniref:M56 family metallopeptidase n=2 Tax=Blautia wexlerae TaxID=418240 RepID=UPI00189DD5A1